MRFTIAIVLLVVLVGIAGLVSLNSITNNAILASLIIKGDITDENGYPLWSKSTKSILYNASVALSPDGEIVGWGPLWSVQYQVNIYKDWKDYEYVTLMIGNFDPSYPARAKLVKCADVSLLNVRTVQKVLVKDVKCGDFQTNIPSRLMAYY